MQTHQQNSKDQEIYSIFCLIQQEKFFEAFKQWVKIYDSNTNFQYSRICKQIKIQLVEKSSLILAGYKTIIESHSSKNAEDYYEVALLHSLQKEYDLAVGCFSETIKLDSSYARAYNHRGTIYICQNQNDERAAADFKKSIELKPDFCLPYNNLGCFYTNKQDYVLALTYFDKAIELNPKYVMAYFNRGFLHKWQQSDDQAIADFSKCIELAPDFYLAHTVLGSMYFEQGKYDLAIAASNTATAEPNVDVFNLRGMIYQYLGNNISAITNFNWAIALDSAHAGSYGDRGSVHHLLGNNELAISDYCKAIELEPTWKFDVKLKEIISTLDNKPDIDQAKAKIAKLTDENIKGELMERVNSRAEQISKKRKIDDLSQTSSASSSPTTTPQPFAFFRKKCNEDPMQTPETQNGHVDKKAKRESSINNSLS